MNFDADPKTTRQTTSDLAATVSLVLGPESEAVAYILIVGGDPTRAEFMAALIGSRGHDVTVAAGGEQGLAVLKDTVPDLVVSDIHMPGIDGFELVRRMRSDPRTAATPVVFYAAGNEDGPARLIAASLGVSHFLNNPAEPEAVLAIIDAALDANAGSDVGPPYRQATSERVGRQSLTRALDCSGDETAMRRRFAQEQVERFHALTARIEELTLANARLEAEAEELKRNDAALCQAQTMEAVGRLSGGLAHDLNNLLQGISGSLELMRSHAGQGRAAETGRYIETAMGSAKRAAALVHRLLAFSRRQTLDPRPIDVNGLVRGMEEQSRRMAGPAVQVQMSLIEAPWPTLCDPHQLGGALLNLIVNASEAMPNGGQLLIETANTVLRDRRGTLKEWPPQDVPPGEYVALTVADTGAGMTPEVIVRAFDPFFTTKPLGQGPGLGLSMVHGFVLQSGGHVRLRSEAGEGTTVAIYLPRHLATAAVAADPAIAAPATASTNGAVVLVVEDEADVRMVICDFLTDLGYTVLEAENGRAGLSIAETGARFDLLVTDVGLPGGMDGRQLADEIRRQRPGLKVLFITGYTDNMAFGSGKVEHGMQVMTKPFGLETLAARIQGMIEG